VTLAIVTDGVTFSVVKYGMDIHFPDCEAKKQWQDCRTAKSNVPSLPGSGGRRIRCEHIGNARGIRHAYLAGNIWLL
jgi:hypothetical protein